jgi:hypothetical protein
MIAARWFSAVRWLMPRSAAGAEDRLARAALRLDFPFLRRNILFADCVPQHCRYGIPQGEGAHVRMAGIMGENAERTGIEAEMWPFGDRKADPPRRQSARKFAMREQRDIPF